MKPPKKPVKNTTKKPTAREERLKYVQSQTHLAIERKQQVISSGGYLPLPHIFVRDILPKLVEKYDGQSARDALMIYLLLSTYVNGDYTHELYMWSYPTVEQIIETTGIHRNRIKKLCDILENERLILAVRLPHRGHTKKIFMPLLPDTGGNDE